MTLFGNVYIFDDSPEICDTFWTRNDKKINSEEKSGKFFEVKINNPSLTITNVSTDDAGEYRLIAINDVGSTTSDFLLGY